MSNLLKEGNLFAFIGGPAGTGKTWMAQRWAEENPIARVMTATTGIAAVNLGGARTINSLLRGYYDTKSLMDYWTTGKISQCLANISRSGMEEILIDEASMLSGAQLDIMVMAIDEHNSRVQEGVLEGCNYIGLILVGDFCQLPSINESYAFESQYWDRFETNMTILTEIKRQTDVDFVEALYDVRSGDPSRVKKAAGYFEPHMNKICDPDYPGATIFAKNAQVSRYNELGLNKCRGERYSFPSTRMGELDPSWKHIPDRLQLKKGALVMLLANKHSGGAIEYCNGDLANVVSADMKEEFPGCVVELMRNGNHVRVDMIKRSNKRPTGAKGERKEREVEVGFIRYMPLRLCYSSTVHKMQGLTVDAAQIDFRDQFYSAVPGMLYVALSRARSPQGLRLVGNPDLFIKRAKSDPKVARWL